MLFFRNIYRRIPNYGQLILRRGTTKVVCGKLSKEIENYYSLMLKGERKGLFGSGTFYLVFTESCLQEAIKRGEINAKYADYGVPFGKYTGISHIENAGRLKNTFDCIFLHVFSYKTGGHIDDKIIVLSDRQFRRAVVRAKVHPELVVKQKFWHRWYQKFFCKVVEYAES